MIDWDGIEEYEELIGKSMLVSRALESIQWIYGLFDSDS